MKAADIIYGRSALARTMRTILHPLSALFGSVVGLRNYLFDTGRLFSADGNIPVISVGNISVGGTGKTPVTAWLASRLLEAGLRPGIILRGYGGDEQLVHAHLNPGVPVVADADRLRGVMHASREGAEVAILDDAFQHRRINRGWDIVLLSADRWSERMALLPSGDLREPLSSLERASLVVITRKAASRDKAIAIESVIRKRFRHQPIAIALLAPDKLRDREGNMLPMTALEGQEVLAISAVGDNSAFQSQLEELRATVRFRAFPDHHAYSVEDVAGLARESSTVQFVICTLKDAVKLWPEWPADAKPLWYVSQALVLESGAGALDELISQVTATKRNQPQTGGLQKPLDSKT
ncbi:MAG: tetraacyldisaccharide 4'-kinase [Gemmatimonadaceae bacterium]|nr:tetraacyldisaccharide 4'-kinase [Gemmatimonadaceae bacterium]